MTKQHHEDYFNYMSDFLKYFKYIIHKYDDLNKELHISIIEECENDKNLKNVEEVTDLMHMFLYRKKNIDFINYWHFQRCCENNMLIPI